MKLTVHEFTTLDGVMQGPGGADEDRSNGFEHGGWLVPFVDEDFGAIVDGWFAQADEILLGRTTYEMMYPYWSQVTDPDDLVGQKLNSLPKHVVSRSRGTLEWQNATVLGGDVAEAVAALKARPGRELQVHGSWQLVQSLHALGLIDEYRILVFPIVLGTGKRLFDAHSRVAALELVEQRRTSRGATHLVMRPTATPRFGDFDVEDGAGVSRLR